MKQPLRWIALLLGLAATALPARADEGDKADLQKKYEEKLHKEFIDKTAWVRTYEEARAIAKKEGKLVLGFFTRSYAPCPPCNQLEGSVLISDWWVKLTGEFVPYLNVTTHLEDTPDQGLLTAKGGNGFPTLYFIEPETGAVLNDWWWPETEEVVRDAHAKAKEKAAKLQELVAKAKASPDDAALQASLKLKLGMMRATDTPIEELGRLAKTPGIPPELKAEFDEWYVGRRIDAAKTNAAETATSRTEYTNLVQSGMYAILKEGLRVAPEHQAAQELYGAGLDGAIAKGDREIAEVAFQNYEKALQHVVATMPQYKDQVEKRIEESRSKLAAMTK